MDKWVTTQGGWTQANMEVLYYKIGVRDDLLETIYGGPFAPHKDHVPKEHKKLFGDIDQRLQEIRYRPTWKELTRGGIRYGTPPLQKYLRDTRNKFQHECRSLDWNRFRQDFQSADTR